MVVSDLEVLEVIFEDAKIVGGQARSTALSTARATGRRSATTDTDTFTDAFFDSSTRTFNADSQSFASSSAT